MVKAASVLGATGVGLGAIGAHAFKKTLEQRASLASWQTATLYQLFHATALLGLSSQSKDHSLAGQCMTAGTIMFSGSIYCLSLGVGPKALLGPTTPLGGLLMIGGWVLLGLGSQSTSKGD